MAKKEDKRTYDEGYRFTGYFNHHYSLIIKAYSHSRSLKKSGGIVQLCLKAISEIDESDINKMVTNYLNAKKNGEVK